MQLSLVMFQLSNFWCQNIDEKVVHKMLMKETPGLFSDPTASNVATVRPSRPGRPIAMN